MRLSLIFFLVCVTVRTNAAFALPDVSYNESKIDSLYEIVQRSDLPYASKIAMMDHYNNISLHSEHYQKLNLLFLKLLEEAYTHSDMNGLLFCFNSMANIYLGLWDRKRAGVYLDSAGMYVDKADDLQSIALYYGIRAQYLQQYFPNRAPEAINDYQYSLSCFDKAGIEGHEDEYTILLWNLTIDGFQRDDSVYVYHNIRKIEEVKSDYDSPLISFIYMNILSLLNEARYQEVRDECYLDSVKYYTQRCLELYEAGLLPRFFNHTAVDLYVVAAEMMALEKNTNVTVIDSLLSLAKEKYNVADSAGIARIYQTQARAFFERGMIDSAEVRALQAQQSLEAGYMYNYFALIKKNIDLLRDIYAQKGDFKKAIEYDELWTKKDEEMKANVVKELELKYEVDAKDLELRQLNSELSYYENRHKMYVLICVLLCLTSLIVILLFRSNRKDLKNQFALMKAEKEEAKLKLKLKEEQAVKAQLEKFEVLSDFHLKEMELVGMTKDLEQLYKDKEALDRQVELYRQKVEAYESLEEQDGRTNVDVLNVIKEDVKRLLLKYIPDSDIYIQNLDALDESYIDALCEKSAENLSVSYLKYCVCFAIGMEISEVAECFHIEQSSVHMIRYRLKKKFKLGNDDDLGIFLQHRKR
jgi:hypothetical protein